MKITELYIRDFGGSGTNFAIYEGIESISKIASTQNKKDIFYKIIEVKKVEISVTVTERLTPPRDNINK